MSGWLAVIVKFTFLFAVGMVFLIAAAGYTASVVQRAVWPQVAVIGEFQDVAHRETDRAPYLLARAAELAEPVRLDALYEVKVPPLEAAFGRKDDLKFLDDVKINIEGVDLPKVIKSLFAALPDDTTIVTAQAETIASGSAVRLEWKERSGKTRKWLLRSDKPPSDVAAMREIVDQAIYRLVYNIYYDPAVVRSDKKRVPFPNVQALSAYYSGQQYLAAYQRRLGLVDAASAEKRAANAPTTAGHARMNADGVQKPAQAQADAGDARADKAQEKPDATKQKPGETTTKPAEATTKPAEATTKPGEAKTAQPQDHADAALPVPDAATPHSDLNQAEKQFRILYREMPNFTDGLMLLGITLMEQKKEPEAIVIFTRVRDNLLAEAKTNPRNLSVDLLKAALKKLDSDKKKALLSAMLFRATAERKLYRVENNHAAFADIENILAVIDDLHKPLPPQPIANLSEKEKEARKADRLDFLKVHISALAEKAYVLGAYLILLDQDNFIGGLKASANPPEFLKRKNTEQQQLDDLAAVIRKAAAQAKSEQTKVTPSTGDQATAEQKAKADQEKTEREQTQHDAAQAKPKRLAAYRAAMELIFTQHTAAVRDAKKLIEEDAAEDDAWKRAAGRFTSDLDNAAGFARFRHAQATMDVDPKIDDDGVEDAEKDKAFLSACRQAIRDLQEAYAVHQNEQSILLNLGLIESFPRCDRKGVNIGQARKYLRLARALKPSDYYAPQLLASLGIRETYMWGLFAEPGIVNETVEAAENARELRPESGTILAVLAQAHVLQWAPPADAAAVDSLAAKIDAAIAQADKRGATRIHLATVRLQWLVKKVALTKDDKDNKLFKQLQKLVGETKSEVDEDRTWYGYQLKKDVAALETKLTTMETDADKDKRKDLRWPG